MNPSLWFVVPAHGRTNLTRICLTMLRTTCNELCRAGINANAVVIADDENLKTADDLGFAYVERENDYLGRKFNDGIQLACDPRHNPRPADYVVPCGSDDWVDYRAFLDLPARNTMVGFLRVAFVREDGRELVTRQIDTPGGCGIRIYPRKLMQAVDWRPADEDRNRAIDTSILYNTRRHNGDTMRIMHRHHHDHQIVDWKSPSEQLNPFETLRVFQSTEPADPFEVLADTYPAEALAAMQAHYEALREPVAA